MGAASPWDPLTLNSGARLRNRFVLAPMTTDSSNPNGTVSDSELQYLKRRCSSEFAAGITSCAYVHEHGRAWRGIGAVDASHLTSLREVAAAVRCGGGLAILQLYDGGRIADPGIIGPDRLRAPSAVASARPGAVIPRALTADEIDGLLDSFERAALMGQEAGFDGIEIHGANHYLVHQFFSPRANQRDDEWGGSPERRMRFPLAVTRRLRAALDPRMALGFRVNPFEPEIEGFRLEDAAILCSQLSDLGADYVHISMDDFRKNSPMREDRDWSTAGTMLGGRNPIVAIAEAIEGRSAVVASGGITTIDDAAAALDAGAHILAIGRATLIDPEWLHKVRAGEHDTIRRFIPPVAEQIEAELTIPTRMVHYLLSRPGWIPQGPPVDVPRSPTSSSSSAVRP